MRDSVERFAKVQYRHVNLFLLVKSGVDIVCRQQQLGLTGMPGPKPVV